MDSDPAPGDPDEVRTLADSLQTFADDVGEALGRIRGLAEDRAVLDWAGRSAEAFRAEFDGVPGNLQKLQTSYDLAAQALQTYWPRLETAQGMADRALDRAIAAQADLSTAQAALTDAQDWVSRTGTEAERLEEQSNRDTIEPPSEAEIRAATRDATAPNQAASSVQSGSPPPRRRCPPPGNSRVPSLPRRSAEGRNILSEHDGRALPTGRRQAPLLLHGVTRDAERRATPQA